MVLLYDRRNIWNQMIDFTHKYIKYVVCMFSIAFAITLHAIKVVLTANSLCPAAPVMFITFVYVK